MSLTVFGREARTVGSINAKITLFVNYNACAAAWAEAQAHWKL